MISRKKLWQEKLVDKSGYPKVLKLERRFPCFNAVHSMGANVGDEVVLVNPRDSLGYRVTAKSVERIADHAVRIAQDIALLDSEVGEPSFKRISDLSLFARSVFDDAIKSLFKKDYSLADGAVSEAKTIVSMETEALKVISRNVEPTQLSSIRIIMESIRRTAEYAGDIAEIVLNLNVNQVTET